LTLQRGRKLLLLFGGLYHLLFSQNRVGKRQELIENLKTGKYQFLFSKSPSKRVDLYLLLFGGDS